MSDIKLSKVSDGVGVNKEDGELWCTANAVDSKIKSLQAELDKQIEESSYYERLVESKDSDNALLTEKVKELEGNLELALSLLGDGEHSFYLNG